MGLVRRGYGHWRAGYVRGTVACCGDVGGEERSVLEEAFGATPIVVQGRGHLDPIRQLVRGGNNNGEGCRHRSLPRSPYCNNYKVSEYSQGFVNPKFWEHVKQDTQLYAALWKLSGLRLVCHGPAALSCRRNHCGVQEIVPLAFDREASDPRHKAVPVKNTSWCGGGVPMPTSGVHYVTCAMGHRFVGSMAHATPHLHSATWQTIVESGTPSLLTNLGERWNIAASRRSSLELKPSIHDDLNCLAWVQEHQ